MTRQEILRQLEKDGINDLGEFADFLVKNAHEDGDPSKPIIQAFIIYHHGFMSH